MKESKMKKRTMMGRLAIMGVAAGLTLCAGRTIAQETATKEPTTKEPTWADRLSMKGDFRFRYEGIDQEGSDQRTRFRGRLRLNVAGIVNDDTTIKVRLASGSDDPVSSNQSFGDGWDTKNYGLDQAYIDWHPAAYEGLELYAGKMAKPWVYVKDLVWDGDLNPEGVSVQYEMAASDTVSLRGQAGYFFIQERKTDEDTAMYNAQLVAEMDGEAVDIMIGGGVYMYDNMAGYETVFVSDDGFGNTTTEDEEGTQFYVNEYELAEAMATVTFKARVPVTLYFDYIVNMDVDEEDTGYLAGITLGKAKTTGSWQFDYNYRNLDADCTVAAYSDSDFGGGGTGAKGSRAQLKYQLSKGLQLVGSHFANTLADDKDYQRTQIDLVAKF